MDERYRKINHGTASCDFIAPPILLRRRLSAPETIMRKHLLAHQRSSSRESRKSSDSDTQSCSWPLNGGSDPNLSRRKDTDIRKSTLMKRFWENSKNIDNFPKTYSEWQYSFGRMKFASSHSTLLFGSPKHSRRKSGNEDNSASVSVRTSPLRLQKPRMSQVDQDTSYAVYSSNFSNVTSTENTSRMGTDDCANNALATRSYRITSEGIQCDDPDRSKELPELPIKYQFVIDNQMPRTESATQTNDTTNLNVITNVQLSQSTLNLIFDRVMQDVISSSSDNVKALNIDNVQKPLFPMVASSSIVNSEDGLLNINQTDDKTKISAINAGSPYKSNGSPTVPRLSALPRSTSMEVNVSSNDSLDKEVSFDSSPLDSLEDMKASTIHREKLSLEVSDNDLILPDNSEKLLPLKKSSVFYIPIDNELGGNNKNSVSEALPSKLKERLHNRQLKREEKKLDRMKQDLQNSNLISDYFSSSSPHSETRNYKSSNKSAKTKTMLPKIDPKKSQTTNKQTNDRNSKSFWLPKTRRNINAPKTKSKWENNQVPQLPKKNTIQKLDSGSSSGSSKHIEIIEIMEIIEPDRNSVHLTPKTKSKIPVLQNSNTKLPRLQPKPSFLNFNAAQGDPKLDQLIANILIDTLNHPDSKEPVVRTRINNINDDKANGNRNIPSTFLDDTADLITKQVLDNNNVDAPKLAENIMDLNYMNVENIPRGWITFYMLQNNQNQTPDSTSDEGLKTTTQTTERSDVENVAREKKSLGYAGEEQTDSESESGTRRKREFSKKVNDEKSRWSVTVSGSNNGQTAPDLEMKLKFPHLRSLKHEKKSGKDGLNYEDICNKAKTSEIDKSKQYLKNCEKSERSNTLRVNPRPTKTSKQRYMMHKPIEKHQHEDRSTQLGNILEGFSTFLSVHGNSVQRGRQKHLLPKINEDDLKRLLMFIEQQKNVN